MFVFIGVVRFLYTAYLYTAYFPFLSSSSLPLFSLDHFLIASDSFPCPLPGFLHYSLCTLPHSNERYHMVFKLVCLGCFTQSYTFHVYPFSMAPTFQVIPFGETVNILHLLFGTDSYCGSRKKQSTVHILQSRHWASLKFPPPHRLVHSLCLLQSHKTWVKWRKIFCQSVTHMGSSPKATGSAYPYETSWGSPSLSTFLSAFWSPDFWIKLFYQALFMAC